MSSPRIINPSPMHIQSPMGSPGSSSASAKRMRIDGTVEVAYLGQKNSYTFLAARKMFSPTRIPYFSGEIQFVSRSSIQEVFHAVVDGTVKYGVLPLESSTNGTLHGVYDRLLSFKVCRIVGEMGDFESHCLCARPELSNENNITHVITHPLILEDCSQYLDALDERRKKLGNNSSNEPFQPIFRGAAIDSAQACVQVATNESKTMAVICSKEAAIENGLQILASSIGNDKNGETRYVVIARTDGDDGECIDPLSLQYTPPLGTLNLSTSTLPQKKATVVMALKNVPGSIFRMSSCFALRDIDIIKIESRPANTALQSMPVEARPFTQQHWSLIFHVDYTLPDDPEKNKALMANLKEFCLWIREFGQYYGGLRSIESAPQNFNQILELL